MTVTVVTRGGFGDVWRFSGPRAAWEHPLVQTYDVVIETEADVGECWNHLFLHRMALEVLGDARLSEEIRQAVLEGSMPADPNERSARFAHQVHEALLRIARDPPAKSDTIMALVISDRQRYDAWHTEEAARRRPLMAEASTTTAAKAPAAPKTVAGLALDAKLTFGADKDSKSFGPKNNPKREGSASAARFALYKDGMTVQKALDAGIAASDIAWDIKKGFIKAA